MRARTSADLEQLLFDGRPDRAEARRDEVGEPRHVGDVRGERSEVLGQHGRQLDDLLEVCADVALERVDLEARRPPSARRPASLTSARRYGLASRSTRSSRMRARPWTISRRLPSGSLNILWMWVSVPIGVQVGLARILLRRDPSA